MALRPTLTDGLPLSVEFFRINCCRGHRRAGVTYQSTNCCDFWGVDDREIISYLDIALLAGDPRKLKFFLTSVYALFGLHEACQIGDEILDLFGLVLVYRRNPGFYGGFIGRDLLDEDGEGLVKLWVNHLMRRFFTTSAWDLGKLDYHFSWIGYHRPGVDTVDALDGEYRPNSNGPNVSIF